MLDEKIMCDEKLEEEKITPLCRYGECDGYGYITEMYINAVGNDFVETTRICQCHIIERDEEDNELI